MRLGDEQDKHPIFILLLKHALELLLMAGAISISVAMILVATHRRLTAVEGVLFQAIALVLGVLASYIFARQSVRAAAAESVRQHARSAFRRVLSLYEGLRRFGIQIEARRRFLHGIARQNRGLVPTEHVDAALDLLRAQVTEQIGTANDAAEDWRDLVPDEVAEVERRAEIAEGESRE